MMRTLLLIIVIGTFTAVASPQITASAFDRDDVQSWNDLQLTLPIGKKVDFQTRFTLRLGQNVTALSDGRFAVGFNFKPLKPLSIQTFYSFIKSQNVLGRYRIENRLSAAASYRLPIKRFGLIHRSGFERRFRRPRDTWRYRAMLQFEKDIPKTIIAGSKFFMSDEVFYDSGLERFSRNRFTIGITKTLTKELATDIYYMRQNDGFTLPGDLHVIGTLWKIRL